MARSQSAGQKDPVSPTRLELDILQQPTDTTCGPTCLHAVYRYHGLELPLLQLIQETHILEGGGTLAVFLACDALRRGFTAKIYTYNLRVFDPSWFEPGSNIDLSEPLKAQSRVKSDPKILLASNAYREYLRLGGIIRFEDLTADLIRRHLKKGRPILTGLSATYLYHCQREIDDPLSYDDLKGVPQGHFVVLAGYDKRTGLVQVADPLLDNPRFRTQFYEVRFERLLGAIMLGVLTFDANLLIIEPSDTVEESS